jgi:hypothetical protein
MDTLLSICIGVGLAAACGFRVFVPLLVMSAAAYTGRLELAPSFQWISTDAALITFAIATALEIGAYYVPWLDNFLDSIATPIAVVAGTVVTASMVTNVDPFLRWTLAVIAGGGVAALVQGSTVVTRAVSTASTGGLGNAVVSTAELGLSAVTSVLAIVVPLVAILLMGVVGVGVGLGLFRKLRKPKQGSIVLPPPPLVTVDVKTPQLLSQ